jgi:type IV secretion system protein VirB6
LALGPLFIALLFFDATRRFFTAWIAQLANYGLITILTVMVAALLLKIVQSYAAQTAARGAAILTVDALNMMLVAFLVFLVLRQVMPIASGLAGGASLSSLGVVSRSISSGLASFRKNHADPAMNKARPYVRDTLGEVAGGTGAVVRGAAMQSRQALVRSWRNWRR